MAEIVKRRPVTRWVAPLAAVALVGVGAVVTTAAASADDAPVLPPRSAEQLLVDLHQPTTTAFSGEIAVHSDLGLPDVAGLLGGGTSDTGVVPPHAADMVAGDATGIPALGGLTGLLTGDHTLRVWFDAPERSRVAVVGNREESDVVKNGTDLWVWQSTGSQVLHATLPTPDEVAAHLPSQSELPDEVLAQLPKTPQEAAAALLDAVGPTTAVTSESTASVAGRPAYLLVATPKTPGTLVARVVVAIDSETHVPLRLEVYSTQRTQPAASIGFTSVSFETPSADVFAFTPPAGATVTELPEALKDLPSGPTTRPDGARPDVTTVGEGWATVAILTPPAGVPATAPGSSGAPGVSGLLDALPQVSGPWGSGHALAGTLFSVLVADDGRIAVGAVPVATLEDALAGTTP